MVPDAKRSAAAVLAVAGVAVSMACIQEVTFEVTVVNNTDSPICFFNDSIAEKEENCQQVEIRGTRTFRVECTAAGHDFTPGEVVLLTAGPSGREIYKRAALCDEWSDSGGQIVVDETNGRFVVVDSLPDRASSP